MGGLQCTRVLPVEGTGWDGVEHVPHGPGEAAAMAAWPAGPKRGKSEHHGGHKERAGRTDHRLRYFPSTFGGAVFCVRRPVASTGRTPGQRRERCTAGGAIALPSFCRSAKWHCTQRVVLLVAAAAAAAAASDVVVFSSDSSGP